MGAAENIRNPTAGEFGTEVRRLSIYRLPSCGRRSRSVLVAGFLLAGGCNGMLLLLPCQEEPLLRSGDNHHTIQRRGVQQHGFQVAEKLRRVFAVTNSHPLPEKITLSHERFILPIVAL